MFLKNKAFCHGMVNGGNEGSVIVPYIEQTDRFFMCTRLCPGDSFEQFIEGAKTAWHGDVTVCQFMHACLSSMHPFCHIHLGESYMSKRHRVHRGNDHPDDLPSRLQDGICHHTHESGLSAAIDETDSSFSQSTPHKTRAGHIILMNRIGRSTENTN